MSTNVLEPCPIPEGINTDYLKGRLLNYFDEERMEVNPGNLQIEPGRSEYWIAKATEGKRVGAGSEGTDVITPRDEGIDATCLCIASTNATNEKSLCQGLEVSKELANYFEGPNKDADKATEIFKNAFSEKLRQVKDKFSLKVLYLLAFISSKTTVRVICFRYNLDNMTHISSAGFTTAEKSIHLANVIDAIYGNVKLYSSKNRIELRLTKAAWEHPYSVEVFKLAK